MPAPQWGSRPLALRVYQGIGRVIAPLWREVERRRASGDAHYRPASVAAWDGVHRRKVCTPSGESGDKILSSPIWVHAASVGEGALAACIAMRPVHSSWILSIGTNTGRDAVKRRFPGLGARVVRPPVDVPRDTRSFFDACQPRSVGHPRRPDSPPSPLSLPLDPASALLLVESELWPTMMTECATRNIPIMVVNGRMSPQAFARWRRFRFGRSLVRAALSGVAHVMAQSAEDAERFRALGASSVSHGPSLKFVGAPSVEGDALARFQAAVRGAGAVFACASLHEGEFAAAVEAAVWAREHCEDVVLLLQPRHVAEAGALTAALDAAGIASAAAGGSGGGGSRVVVVDEIVRPHAASVYPHTPTLITQTAQGTSDAMFAVTGAAFVGGSLVPRGGHNPLEALRCGCPVFTGPHVRNFEAVHRDLRGSARPRVVQSVVGALAAWRRDEARLREAGGSKLADRARRRALVDRVGAQAAARLDAMLLGVV